MRRREKSPVPDPWASVAISSLWKGENESDPELVESYTPNLIA